MTNSNILLCVTSSILCTTGLVGCRDDGTLQQANPDAGDAHISDSGPAQAI